MTRARFEMPTAPVDSRQYGEGYYGGYDVDSRRQYDKYGNPTTTIVGKSGDQVEVDRYRGMGEAAANRDAYQVNFDRANQDARSALAARGNQTDAASMLRAAAYGNAPSAAAIQGQQVGGQSLAGALAAGGGARGMAAPTMQRAAMMQQQQQQLGGLSQFAGMRAGEMDAARGGYLGGVTGMREQDYRGQALFQRQAEAQAQAENFQRDLNQQGQMGYEQMGFDVNAEALNAGLRRKAIQAQLNEADRKASESQTARAQQLAGAVMSGVAGVAGYAGSAAGAGVAPKPGGK